MVQVRQPGVVSELAQSSAFGLSERSCSHQQDPVFVALKPFRMTFDLDQDATANREPLIVRRARRAAQTLHPTNPDITDARDLRIRSSSATRNLHLNPCDVGTASTARSLCMAAAKRRRATLAQVLESGLALQNRKGKDGTLGRFLHNHVDRDEPPRVGAPLGYRIETPFLGKVERGLLLVPPTRHALRVARLQSPRTRTVPRASEVAPVLGSVMSTRTP